MRFLLITDLDNTLVGDNHGTLTLSDRLFYRRDQFYLIYATGRSFDSVCQLMGQFQLVTGYPLLTPDYIITGVGSEIYYQGQLDQTWADQISSSWNRQAIEEILQKFPDLIPQPINDQNPWKLSFHINPIASLYIVDELQEVLSQAHLSCQIIFSSGRDIDILPSNANKGLAATYLREYLEIPLDYTLVCGDSGNDISLFQQATLGVIVNNAQLELCNWYERHQPPHIYFASAPYAWGILEGLSYFKLI